MAPASVIDKAGLPSDLEAHEPPEARGLTRDGVRLLVSHTSTTSIRHSRFRDLPQWLSPGDLIVVNTSGTLNAAVAARTGDGQPFEVHFSTRMPGNFWVVEVRQPGPIASLPYRQSLAGTVLELEGDGFVTLLAPYPLTAPVNSPSRLWLAAVQVSTQVPVYLERFGQPIHYSYVTRPWPASMYQTAFVTEPGSAEMPSAGRPFTPELIARLVADGIGIAPVLLHTGVASVEDHEPPYEEYFQVPPETADRVNAARGSGRRVVAVGTTVIRALETVTDDRGVAHPGKGWTDLVIGATRPLRAVNAMITGFHEPRATHLAMVRQALDAAGSHDPSSDLNRAYAEAQRAGYLWHEFGDSHLILGGTCSSTP